MAYGLKPVISQTYHRLDDCLCYLIIQSNDFQCFLWYLQQTPMHQTQDFDKYPAKTSD
jgi:hypothetical protein